jgi:hypothetical protein
MRVGIEKYVEEDTYLTIRKMRRLSQTARKPLEHATKPEDVSNLVAALKSEADVLATYPEEIGRIKNNGRRNRHGPSIQSASETEGELLK